MHSRGTKTPIADNWTVETVMEVVNYFIFLFQGYLNLNFIAQALKLYYYILIKSNNFIFSRK